MNQGDTRDCAAHPRPCPFCGSTWIAYSSDPIEQRELGCGHCFASAPEKAWNARVGLPELKAENERLRVVLRELFAEVSGGCANGYCDEKTHERLDAARAAIGDAP